jgi:Family of unknown function (DUF6526)
MAQSTQTYKTHRRYWPVYHFFVEPVLVLNIVVELARLNKYRTIYKVWEVLVAIALAIFVIAARSMALRAQDRGIRIEERARLAALLPADMRGRVGDLTSSQLIGLRFASDEELPDLARRCLDGELTKAEQVKKQIRTWRPDLDRV